MVAEACMRAAVLGVFLFISTLIPTIGTAQVYRSATPAPQVTAAGADWQVQREPIYFAGNTYYPTGPNVFFDQWVMSRTGSYKGVPLYVDSTLQPYSIIYVPIGGNLLRPYERRRDGELTGTIGNRTPSFTTTRDGEMSVSGATATIGSTLSTPSGSALPAPIPEAEPMVLLETDRPVKTNGSAASASSNTIESIPAPRTNRGIWITWEGEQWYPAGATVPLDRDRFVAVGDYHGFPVYREKTHDAGAIFVPAVKGGLLTPYRR
jgi:hypothetical protein